MIDTFTNKELIQMINPITDLESLLLDRLDIEEKCKQELKDSINKLDPDYIGHVDIENTLDHSIDSAVEALLEATKTDYSEEHTSIVIDKLKPFQDKFNNLLKQHQELLDLVDTISEDL